MVERALEGAAGTLSHGAATPRRARRGSLAAAFAVSLLAHLVLLSWLPIAPARKPARSDPLITLSAVIVAPVAPVAPRAVVAAPAVQPVPETGPRPPLPRAARAATEPRGAPPPPPATTQAAAFVSAEDLAQPPAPLEDPLAAVPVRELLGRRLVATVWVLPDGTVRKAEVRRNEIPEEVAVALEQAIARTRFVPGRAAGAGAPVAAVFSTHLCFGEDGLLEAPDPECWRPAAPQR